MSHSDLVREIRRLWGLVKLRRLSVPAYKAAAADLICIYLICAGARPGVVYPAKLGAL